MRVLWGGTSHPCILAIYLALVQTPVVWKWIFYDLLYHFSRSVQKPRRITPPPMVEVLISQSGQVVKKIVEVGGQNCRFPGVKRVVRESEAVTFKGRMEQKKWQ